MFVEIAFHSASLPSYSFVVRAVEVKNIRVSTISCVLFVCLSVDFSLLFLFFSASFFASFLFGPPFFFFIRILHDHSHFFPPGPTRDANLKATDWPLTCIFIHHIRAFLLHCDRLPFSFERQHIQLSRDRFACPYFCAMSKRKSVVGTTSQET